MKLFMWWVLNMNSSFEPPLSFFKKSKEESLMKTFLLLSDHFLDGTQDLFDVLFLFGGPLVTASWEILFDARNRCLTFSLDLLNDNAIQLSWNTHMSLQMSVPTSFFQVLKVVRNNLLWCCTIDSIFCNNLIECLSLTSSGLRPNALTNL